MSITIQITSELGKQLAMLAKQKGIDANILAAKMLKEKLEEDEDKLNREDKLLQKINVGLPSEVWDRYEILIDKRKNLTLTEVEQKELIQISDRIELSNVNRIKHLIELSQLKKVSLDDLMKELQIKAPSYV